MDIPNKHLDDTIAYSLETQTVITPAQKNRAWEKLKEKAEQQVILVPYAVPPSHSLLDGSSIDPAFSLSWWVRRLFSLLITDEAMYHRAALRRDTLLRLAYASTPNGSQVVIRFHMTDIMRYGLL